MSKELEALEILKTHIIYLEGVAYGVDKTIVNHKTIVNPYAREYELIKSALKEKEKLENENEYLNIDISRCEKQIRYLENQNEKNRKV